MCTKFKDSRTIREQDVGPDDEDLVLAERELAVVTTKEASRFAGVAGQGFQNRQASKDQQIGESRGRGAGPAPVC